MSNKQMISAENIKISFGEQTVLEIQNFKVYEGDRIGLVGANGVGKTTLLRILAGELRPDEGVVKLGCEPFYFRQFDENWDSFSIDPGEVSKLGVRDQIWQDNVSGGENTRIRLAELFSVDSAVAFLDEPSANLDIKGIELLKRKLLRLETFVLVSHDRSLMNEVCTKIVEISFGNLNEYQGNYDRYRELKQAELDRANLEYEQYRGEKRRLENVYSEKKSKAGSVTKRPKNLSSSEAKVIEFGSTRPPGVKQKNLERSATNVLKRIEHLEVKEKPKELPKIRPDFRLTNPPENRYVIRGEHITFGYDDKLLYDDISFLIENRSKVAIVGDNGTGKTTLLNMIEKGEDVYVVPGAKIGYIRQDMSDIDPEKTVLENVLDVSIQSESLARIILARLLLTNKDMNKKAENLSGGERMKLMLARLFVSDVNLFVLDEPTNFLDLPSIEALEQLLVEFEGTVVFVSHDREFTRNVATELLILEDRKLRIEKI